MSVCRYLYFFKHITSCVRVNDDACVRVY